MRVLMYSWEYPPKSVGGLAQHVYQLSRALQGRGAEIHVITCGGPGLPQEEEEKGVYIHRVTPYHLSAPDFRTWILQLNMAMMEYTSGLLQRLPRVDLVHAHDWLVAFAARAVKNAYHIPLVATIHATEYGRNQGLHNDDQRHISDVEWWLTFEAWKVIVCSEHMRHELSGFFQIPQDKLVVINNGVNPGEFRVEGQNREALRHSYAPGEDKVVFFVGRLVREKGVQVLLDAVPRILSYFPKTKFIIAGKGPYQEELQRKAREMGLGGRVRFTGYIDDETRNNLYFISDVAVFPSLYEPFGIVALEGMAAKTPVVVSDTGGLREIVRHGVNGLKAMPGSASSLSENILTLLTNPHYGEQLEKRAFREIIKSYNWYTIAENTIDIYREVAEQSRHQWPARMPAGAMGALLEKVREAGRYVPFGVRPH